MEIIPLDRNDDILLKALAGLDARSQEASRVQPVRQSAEEFTMDVRFSYPGEVDEGAVALVDGEPAGWTQVFLPQRDNLDKCWSHLKVDPRRRHNRVSSALLERLEGRARAAKRDLLLTQVFVPVGGRESHADREFALGRGYSVSSIEIVRSLPLPVPVGHLDRLRSRATEGLGDTYELSTHVDGVPEELRQGVGDASNRLILDAPTGDVDFEAESMTVEDYETTLGHQLDSGRSVITTVAVHRETGVVAGYT